MSESTQKDLNFESSFDINKVSFESVSKDFEKKFRERYKNSLAMMSDSKDRIANASGATSLGVLEKMAQQIRHYDRDDDFEVSYESLVREYEPFNET